MSVCFVFNDTSLPFTSLETCRQTIPIFFSILRIAIQNEVQVIRTNDNIGSNWYNFHYAEEFSLSQWVDQQEDKDYKRYIRTIMDKTECPLVSSDECEILSILDNSEFMLAEQHNQKVFSLGAAFLLETCAVSFCSLPHWEKNLINVVHLQFDEHTDQFVTKDCCVENIALEVHLLSFLQKIKEERQSSRYYLQQLQTSDNGDYNNLIFCTNVLRNFDRLGISTCLLNRIKDVLEKLNKAIQFTSCDFDLIEQSGLDISGESESTKNNRKLIKHRNFKLPNGISYTFDLHVKNFPNFQRLYFFPDYDLQKIYIGYFGNHLPI